MSARRAHHGPRARGQSLVELALVTPLVLVLVVGTVTVVQLARIQLALGAATQASALVAARAADAVAACRGGRSQLESIVAASPPLATVTFRIALAGGCVGPLPSLGSLPLSRSGGGAAIWFGRSPGRAFCRIGQPGAGGGDPGDVIVLAALHPRIPWLPNGGAFLPLRLGARAVVKVDPFRSRDVAITTEGDTC